MEGYARERGHSVERERVVQKFKGKKDRKLISY